MSGVVVVPGIFGPGSAVELYHVAHEATLRPGADSEKVGEPRLVDENGNVGWDGLDIGELYLVVGYVDGWYCVLRNRATDGDSPQISQQPAQEVPQTVGTQRDPVAEPAPEPPENAEELETGIAPGALASMPLEAPVEESNPTAPEAGTPDASDSSGTGQANGGAVEEPETAPAGTDGGATAEGTDAPAQESGVIEGASTSTTVLPEQVGETPVDPSAPPASPDEGADQVAP